MPRKTKKTSIVKPEDTKDCSCLVSLGLFTSVVALIGLVACVVHHNTKTELPIEYACYQNKEDSLTVAQVTKVGEDFGNYTDVTYSFVDEANLEAGMQSKTRLAKSFNEIYEKREDCYKFYEYLDSARIVDLHSQIHSLNEELESCRNSKKCHINKP